MICYLPKAVFSFFGSQPCSVPVQPLVLFRKDKHWEVGADGDPGFAEDSKLILG